MKQKEVPRADSDEDNKEQITRKIREGLDLQVTENDKQGDIFKGAIGNAEEAGARRWY